MDKDKIESFQHNGRTVTIYRDDQCESPREYDNLAVLTCCHPRYTLGDEQHREPMTETEVRESVGDVLAILPLYLYDHGGITMRTGPFGDRWDSGQVGWAYVTKASAEKMGCVGDRHDGDGKVVGQWDEAALQEAIRVEVNVYDDFMTGQCYGYVVTDADGDELESCWGFLGDLDYVRKEAREQAESARNPGQVDGLCDARCES